MKTFFMSINTQFENVGDALICRELLRLASNHGKVVVDTSKCPSSFEATLGLESSSQLISVSSRKAYFTAMLRSRMRGDRTFLLLKPGAYLGKLGFSATRAAVLHVIHLLLRLAGIKIVQIGVSYERLDSANKQYLSTKSRYLHAHYVRDAESLKYARANGLTVNGTLPDLAFNAFTDRSPDTNSQTDRITLGLSFRTGQFDAQEEQIMLFIDRLLECLCPDIIDAIILTAQVEWDVATMQRIQNHIARDHEVPIELVVCYDNIETCEEAYRQCDLVVSNRLHVLLLAASQCQHVLAFLDPVYNAKIVGLFDTVGWSNHAVFADAVDVRSLSPKLQHARSVAVDGTPYCTELRTGFARIVETA
jgi:polysaccharide pyruvyl transferase WcaK-like protein